MSGSPAAAGIVVPGTSEPAKHTSSYDATTRTFTQNHSWGQWSVRHSFHSANSTLDLDVSVLNSGPTAIEALSVYPFGIGSSGALTFPAGCNATGCYKMRSTTDIEHYASPCWGSWIPLPSPHGVAPPQCTPTMPQLILADWTSGAMVATLPQNGQIDGEAHVLLGFPLDKNPQSVYYGGFRVQLNFTQLKPAATAHTQRLSLRFAAGSHSMDGQDIATDTGTRRLLGLANDTLAEFRKRVPNTVNWTNRGPIGAFYFDNCGASCNCNTTLPADCPNPVRMQPSLCLPLSSMPDGRVRCGIAAGMDHTGCQYHKRHRARSVQTLDPHHGQAVGGLLHHGLHGRRGSLPGNARLVS